MNRLPYMDTAWYALLAREIEATSMTAVAARLRVSRGAVSQVFNGTGLYGTGQASADKFGERVLRMSADMRCPFLSRETGEERFITGADCAEYAYRECPTSSSMATRHWQACRQCPVRVPAPVRWNESAGRFIPLHNGGAQRGREQSSPGVAAPDVPPTEKEAA